MCAFVRALGQQLPVVHHGIDSAKEHNGMAHSYLGWMYFRDKQYGQSVVHWQEALNQYPRWWEMHENMGMPNMGLEQFPAAAQEYFHCGTDRGATECASHCYN